MSPALRKAAAFAALCAALAPGLSAQTGSQFLDMLDPASSRGELVMETRETPRHAGEDAQPAVLSVVSEPAGAEVTLNFSRIGSTPLEIRNLPDGNYHLGISRHGYHTATARIEIRRGTTLSVRARLQPITGVLQVSVDPSDAEILINGTPAVGTVFELPVGRHEVRVRRFSYSEFVGRYTVNQARPTSVSVRLAPAAFEITQARLSRGVFNPANPGPSGRAALSFRVSAAGTARMTVMDGAGRPVLTRHTPRFTQWNQIWEWSGEGEQGARLPDGEYLIRVDGFPADGSPPVSLSLPVVLDSSLRIRYSPAASMPSGTLYAPDSLSLPPGTFQLSLDGMTGLHMDTRGELHPLQASLRLGLPWRLEVQGSAALTIRPDQSPPDIAGAVGLKYSFPRFSEGIGLAAAVSAHATSLAAHDVQRRFNGASLALSTEIEGGIFSLLLAPSLDLAFPDGIGAPQPGGRLRVGLPFDLGGLALALSGEVSFPAGPDGLAWPIRSGLEMHLNIDSIFLSGLAGVLFVPSGSHTVFLGAGLGILY